VLQCVAVCCSVLQCVAVLTCKDKTCVRGAHVMLQQVSCQTVAERQMAMSVSSVNDIAVCCSVLLCVAVCCSVLQCVAVCERGSYHVATSFQSNSGGKTDGNVCIFCSDM